MVLSVLLAAILDFLRDSWPGFRRWNSSKLKCYFEHESQVCVSAVHPDMMYNHDNWDLICYFVLQFWKGKTKNRAWHGADLESAYPNCVKTTAWQILLRNALQTLRMPLFEKWALTIIASTSPLAQQKFSADNVAIPQIGLSHDHSSPLNHEIRTFSICCVSFCVKYIREQLFEVSTQCYP